MKLSFSTTNYDQKQEAQVNFNQNFSALLRDELKLKGAIEVNSPLTWETSTRFMKHNMRSITFNSSHHE